MRSILARLVGGGNEAHLSKLRPVVAKINGLEEHYQSLTDEQIREEMAAVRAEVAENAAPTPPSEEELNHPERERRADMRRAREKTDLKRLQAALDDVLPDVFAAAREVSWRKLGMRPFDVQLMGAMVLHQGRISEQRTGEGKTLVGPIAAVLNAMSGRGVHVVTVNDYLAKRDPQWMGPIFHGLGLSLGIVQHDSAFLFDPDYRPSDETMTHLRPVPRREAYAADVTYATNNELGFDYLRDNMVTELVERVQRQRYFAIVDEVDNILIDEARTPLIISGQAEESGDLYYTFARLVPRLKERPEGAEEGGDYFVDLKEHAVSPTEEGIEKIEKLLNVPDIYDVTADPRLARHFEQALRAHALYKVNRDYIVKDGEIVIVDEFTGRQMPGRRWSEGLHQAVEAKEGLRVQRESVTLATITFQNYFRLYDKLSGMTGTAMTEQEEFFKIYGLEVVAIPTHRPMVREDDADLVYRTENDKFEALIDEIAENQATGPSGPGGYRQRREERGALGDAPAAGRQARGAQRQVPREGSAHRGPGRSPGCGDHRHQHGRPGHGHQARRRRRGSGVRGAPPAGPQPGRGGARGVCGGAGHGEGRDRGRARAGGRCRRPAHHRHRAPRRTPHRQPASGPCRAPG